MNARSSAAILVATSMLGLSACATDPRQSNVNGPDGAMARTLGYAHGPITGEQAKEIAARTLEGEALTVEASDEKGDPAHEVKVRVNGEIREVQVRISDGAVMRVETDDDQSIGPDDDLDDAED